MTNCGSHGVGFVLILVRWAGWACLWPSKPKHDLFFFFFLLWTLVFLCFFLHHRGVQVYVFVISNSLNSYLTLLNKSTTKLLSRRSWNLWCCISDGFSVYESQDSISHSNDDWQWWQLSLLFTLIKAGKEWIFRFIRPNA